MLPSWMPSGVTVTDWSCQSSDGAGANRTVDCWPVRSSTSAVPAIRSDASVRWPPETSVSDPFLSCTESTGTPTVAATCLTSFFASATETVPVRLACD